MSRIRNPVLATLLLAPALGEWLSTATPPLDLVLWPPGLVLLISMYGCGALLCREIAHRCGLGLGGLCVLAAAYAVYEEALVDRFWFTPRSPADGGLGHYSEVAGTNVLLATNLTLFHVAVSIVSTVVVVELLNPASRGRTWLGRRGLTVTAIAFLTLPFLAYGDYDLDPMPQLALALLLAVVLVAVAVRLRGHPTSLWDSRAALAPPRRGLGPVAFVAAGANMLLMGLSDTATPWPLAVAAVIAPVVAAYLILRPRVSGPVLGRDGFRVVGGILGFYCVFAAAVGLAGRYDLTLGAVGIAVVLWRVRRRVAAEK